MRKRPLCRWGVLALLLLVLPGAGCATHETRQYFAVRDPETGATNYYRLTITGYGGMGAKYNMEAGYFSSAAVDILRGNTPSIPELDLSTDQRATYDELAKQFGAMLTKEAQTTAAGSPKSPLTFEEQTLQMARYIWLASLSKADIASMGMMQTSSPYQFRKLVLWSKTENLPIEQLATGIQQNIDSAIEVVNAFKKTSDKAAAKTNPTNPAPTPAPAAAPGAAANPAAK